MHETFFSGVPDKQEDMTAFAVAFLSPIILIYVFSSLIWYLACHQEDDALQDF